MRVSGELPLLFRQVEKEAEASHAISNDFVPVNNESATNQLIEVVPVEGSAILEFPQKPLGIERVVRLPEFQDYEAANERLVERTSGKGAEIVNVARLVALITGADLLGNNLRQCKADDVGGREWQVLKVSLLNLRSALGRQCRRFAAASPVSFQLWA